MGVIVLALVANGNLSSGASVPAWVIVAAATAISVGTYVGGWRIIRTLGHRITKIETPQGFAAETSSAVRCRAGRRRVLLPHRADRHRDRGAAGRQHPRDPRGRHAVRSGSPILTRERQGRVMLATIVDWAALGTVILYSFAGALLLTGLFTTGVLFIDGDGGRASPARRAAGALCLTLVAFAIYVMFTTK
jgi:hypothetical protein